MSAEEASPIPLGVIIPAVAVPVAVILLCCVLLIIVIACVATRVSKKKEQQYTNLIARMELLEYEMADECKRGEGPLPFFFLIALDLCTKSYTRICLMVRCLKGSPLHNGV